MCGGLNVNCPQYVNENVIIKLPSRHQTFLAHFPDSPTMMNSLLLVLLAKISSVFYKWFSVRVFYYSHGIVTDAIGHMCLGIYPFLLDFSLFKNKIQSHVL